MSDYRSIRSYLGHSEKGKAKVKKPWSMYSFTEQVSESIQCVHYIISRKKFVALFREKPKLS